MAAGPPDEAERQQGSSRPILVSGSHRSGTTWVGKMIAASPDVGYIHEPFNIDIRVATAPHPFRRWFTYVGEENGGEYEEALRDCLAFKYPLFHNVPRIRSAKDAAKLVRDQGLSLWHRAGKRRPLLKDPHAVFSAEWLADRFDVHVVILVRHPAAFVSSLVIKGWRFPFDHFLSQPLLMERFLSPYQERIAELAQTEADIVEQGILLWNCIYSAVHDYRSNHQDWQILRHEDLSYDPVNEFRKLYGDLGVPFTEHAQRVIERASGQHNPAEQTRREYRRDSRKNIGNWKKRLGAEDIERIRRGTAELSDQFYGDEEW